MPKGDHLEFEGSVTETLGGGQYRIASADGKFHVRAKLSGKMKNHHIRVIPGDIVQVAVSPYDTSHGMITFRGRKTTV